MAGGRGKKLKDGTARDTMYSLRMPTDLREFLTREAAQRTLATGKQVSANDIVLEALREKRTRLLWRRGRV